MAGSCCVSHFVVLPAVSRSACSALRSRSSTGRSSPALAPAALARSVSDSSAAGWCVALPHCGYRTKSEVAHLSVYLLVMRLYLLLTLKSERVSSH